MCKRGDCWSTKHTKEERDEAREGFKRRIHQYLVNNDIDNDFDKDIAAMALDTSTPTTIPTTTSRNFFYNDNKPPDLTIDISFLDCHFNDNG